MERRDRYRMFGLKAVRVTTNMAHSVIMMLVFWLLLDIMQSHIVTKPSGPSVVSMLTKQPLPTPAVASQTHPYGYFAGLRTVTVSREPETHHVTQLPVSQKLVKASPKTPKPLMVKSHPVIKKTKPSQSPVVMVTRKVNKTPNDARGPAPSYNRVDL